MAENKEKILINIEQSNYDGVFGFGAGAKVWQCTKAEAIETMAKAICAKKHCKDICNNCEVWMHFEDCAEAALNALLEGYK